VITGYNTDVEHEGVVYHVQTEDKGKRTPIILSLVYVGGAVLASKRSRYDDLLSAEFDERVLADRLQRQHKLICAAVHAGRIEDLKRLSQSEAGERAQVIDTQRTQPEPVSTVSSEDDEETAEIKVAQEEVPGTESRVEQQRVEAVATDAAENVLQVSLLEEPELRGGRFVNLRMWVTLGPESLAVGVPNARVVLKALGTTFRPVSTSAVTDDDGLVSIFVSLPAFQDGRAAILIRAEAEGQIAELRRIILPS